MARKLIQCATQVKRDAVKRKTINGVEHVIISSATLPDNIVMNGIFYPADEIAASFQTLARTPAPIGHPQDADGNFIPAVDPDAIHEFYAGAYNDNVRQENGRVMVDKVVNVVEARKSERGRRLLDRVVELENNESARPIHTSVGVFINISELDEPAQNEMGQEYSLAASDMFFDHDAILLDDVGAAQPHQGVGMAVNADGESVDVSVVTLEPFEPDAAPVGDGLSMTQLESKLLELVRTPPLSADHVVDVFADRVIYSLSGDLFTVPYSVGNDTVNLTGIPVRVVSETSYLPATNSEGDAMRELMLKALADAAITVNADISDSELLAKHSALKANQTDDSGQDDSQKQDLAAIVANALAPVASRLESLEGKLTANENSEKEALVSTVVANSEKFGLSKEDAEALPVAALKKMAANCQVAHGIPSGMPATNSEIDSTTYDMPE